MKTRHDLVWTALVVAALGGCFRERVLPTTQITCRSDADCPSGFLCRSALARCISRDLMDETPPGLVGDVLADPPVARRDATIAVRFEVSEALASDPNVYLRGRAMTLDEEGTDRAALSYRYLYRVTGTEPEETAAVTIDLLDVFGNAAAGLSGGSVRLDFTPPVGVVSSAMTPASATVGVPVRAAFAFSEALSGDPLVWMTALTGGASDVNWQLESWDATSGFAFAYSPAGSEAEGVWAVWLAATDLAGNVLSPTQVGEVVLDFTAPEVASTPAVQIQPAVARVGRTVTVEVSSTELVVAGAQLVARSSTQQLVFASSAAHGALLGFIHTVAAGDDGSYELWLEGLRDLAGNVAAPTRIGSVVLDGVVPQVASLTAIPARCSAVPGFDRLVLAFRTSEPPATLDVRLGDTVLDCGTTVDAGGDLVQCTYRITGTETEGSRFAVVNVFDAAGNNGLANTRVDFDFTPPSVVVTSAPAPVAARRDVRVGTTIRTNEALIAPPRVWMTGPGGSGAGERNWTLESSDQAGEYTFSYTPAGDEVEGAWAVFVSATDLAGNALSAAALGGVDLDFTLPAVALDPPVQVQPLVARVGLTVTVALAATETVQAGAVLTARSAGGDVVFAASSVQGASLGFMHTVKAGDDGTYTLWLEGLRDLAGNAAPAVSVGNVIFDGVAPQVIGLTATPARCSTVAGFDQLALTFQTSEPPASLDVRLGDQPLSCSTTAAGAGAAVECDYTVTGLEPQGSRFVFVNVFDAAGNTGAANTRVDFDFTPPSVVVTASVSPATARSGAAITTTFQLNETLAGAPAVWMADGGGATRPWSLQSSDGVGGYTFGYAPAGSEAPGAWSVRLSATDLAGNALSSAEIGSVTLDFTAPGVAASPPVQIQPAIARVGLTTTVAITATEPIQAGATLTARSGTGDLVFTTSQASGAVLGFLHTMQSGEDGTYTLWLEGLRDLAGNAASAVSVGSVTLDGVAPTITALTATPSRCSAVSGYRALSVTFTASEPLASLDVRLGTSSLACATTPQGAGVDVACTHTVTGSEPEGSQFIGVSVTDAAGNLGSANTRVELDFTPPRLVTGTAELRLTPAPASLLTQVASLTVGATARVLFSVDEPVSVDPAVRASAPEVLAFTRESGSTTSFVYKHVLAAGSHAQGSYALEAMVQDAVGNTAILPLPLAAPGLVVDSAPPPMLTAAQISRLLYRRAPWGDAETLGIKRFTLKATASAAVEPGATVVVWDDANTATASEVGRTKADGTGAFTELTLNRADRPAVFVTQVDGAGNADSATATRVREVEWTASLAGKVAHSTLENPNSFVSRRWMGTALTVAMGAYSGNDEESGDALALADGVVAPVEGDGSFRLGSPAAASPTQLQDYSMTYDVARSKAVAFVGCVMSYVTSNATWEWNGVFWHKVDVSDPEADGNPSGYGAETSTFDAVRGTVLLYKDDGVGNSMWEWNGASWQHIATSGAFPTGGYFAMAYDSVRDKTFWFGGYGASADTWEWDGAGWHAHYPINPVPPGSYPLPDPEGDGQPQGRSGFSLAFDSARGRTVLFGGAIGGGTLNNETWEWDGVSWRKMIPADPEGDGDPAVRAAYTMAYDAGRGRVVLFGGSSNLPTGTAVFADTWEWDGVSWRKMTPTDPEGDGNPAGRYGAAMAYDHARARVVMLGGRTGFNTTFDETWEWNGVSWRLRKPGLATNPLGAMYPAMAFDPRRGRTVHFGGLSSSPTGETWEWDGITWVKKTPTDPEGDGNPAARDWASMTDGGAVHQMLVFGGQAGATELGDLWSWNGVSWKLAAPTDPEGDGNPAARHGLAIAYDPLRDRTVLFGGEIGSTQYNDTWEWDGASWKKLVPTDPENDGNPGVRRGHTMVFDAARGKVMLLGGYPSSDSWQWNGVSWKAAAYGGPTCHCHGMAYDSARQKVVTFAGQCSGGANDRTYDWNGVGWRLMSPADPEDDRTPGNRVCLGMTYDSLRQRAVVAGGTVDETWEIDFGIDQRPGQVLSVPLGPANIPAGSTLLSVQPTFVSGADGLSGGSSLGGISLLAWYRDEGWREVAVNAAGRSGPASISVLFDQPLDVENLRFQDGLFFAVAPRGTNGVDHAKLATDYAEVQVRYELP